MRIFPDLKIGARAAISFLVLASLGFYAWWKAEYLLLIVISIIFNFGWARCIDIVNHRRPNWAKFTLGIGVALNLLALSYYKYTNFLVDQLNWLASTDYSVAKIALPLAILLICDLFPAIDRWDHRTPQGNAATV
ncbi:hypothetical protein WNY77_12275 [Paraglaciecola mesophila]|uniref:Uncharacterized protein n=1 Tax=Paraglaciecola mesophila TaxID=197222 RepID=A0ABU9SWB2_9ALTE